MQFCQYDIYYNTSIEFLEPTRADSIFTIQLDEVISFKAKYVFTYFKTLI